MQFFDLFARSKKYFPQLKIKYKDESWIFKIIGKFHNRILTEYTTTIGNTIYFPSKKFIRIHPVSSSVMLLHEIVHLYDQKRISKFIYNLSYLFPQILVPVILFLLFILSWKFILPLAILFALPMPAFFRMYWEKRAYLSSFYVMQILGNKFNFDPHLKIQEIVFIKSFKGASYYFMWPFHNINLQFDQALEMTKTGKRPFEDPVFDILDDLLSKM